MKEQAKTANGVKAEWSWVVDTHSMHETLGLILSNKTHRNTHTQTVSNKPGSAGTCL